jgi:hypothetical protein
VPAPGGEDPHAREREVLDLAAVVRIGSEFSAAEQGRARAAAARDPRLRIALNTAGYGLTQTLAAAPQLVARWEDARIASPYSWAVLTAALDAARFGARIPLSTAFLRAAAVGYCTSQQQAEAPENWFEQALAYATEKLHGAVAALAPAGTDMGRVDGYIVADYLIQHASRERRSIRVPASTLDVISSYLRDRGLGAADLSAVAIEDLVALDGVIWTAQTIWPPSTVDQIRARSREIRPGTYQYTRETTQIVTPLYRRADSWPVQRGSSDLAVPSSRASQEVRNGATGGAGSRTARCSGSWSVSH